MDSAKAAVSRDGRAGQHKIGISSSISRNLLNNCISDPYVSKYVQDFNKYRTTYHVKDASLIFSYVLSKLASVVEILDNGWAHSK